MPESRPNPDELLDKLERKEAKDSRGKLKIFLGACAGVGKTYAMLSAAQSLRDQNVDVIIGLVETHGRPETDRLIEGLDVLPLKTFSHRDKSHTEFDLDAALTRKPTLILIDELAHSNASGSRHTKRWQDVEELLQAGIDVYTTVNIQHLEGLNDVVRDITGIRVLETFPDHLFVNANSVNLVDLPTDELLIRLKEGKVYVPDQTQQAIEHFFRKGNLIALRELTLRCMTDRVDTQMLEYRSKRSIKKVWQAKERLLVCVGPKESSEESIRKGYRLAKMLHADWFAVYVETPALQKLSENDRSQILKNLKLAEELGAETHVLSGTHLAQTIIEYASHQNINTIIVTKPKRSRFFRLWNPTLSDQLINQQTDINICVTESTLESIQKTPHILQAKDDLEFEKESKKRWPAYIGALFICFITTGISALFVDYFNLPNIVMLYLLAVVLSATFYGRGPSLLVSFLSVAIFDFVFVEPKWSFATLENQYIVTFLVMLIIALIISNLTSNLRFQAKIASYREQRTNALNALNKELAAALTIEQIIEISTRHISTIFQTKTAILLADDQHKIHTPSSKTDTQYTLPACDLGIAQWVYDNQQPAGAGTQTLSSSPLLYLPLKAPVHIRGTIAIDFNPRITLPEQKRLLDSFLAQIALSIENIHYIDVARNALLVVEAERLRKNLLNAIYQALDPPLTTVLDLSNTLVSRKPMVTEKTRQEWVQIIHQKSRQMHSLVTDLHDVSRLEVGKTDLSKQTCLLQEMIERALTTSQDLLAEHTVELNIPNDLQPIKGDPVLIERLFYHLFENASQYTPQGSLIQVSAEQRQNDILIIVQDNGPGLPAGMEEDIFKKFIRGTDHSTLPSVGIGLALCRTILEAHGGQIYATSPPKGGAKFMIQIPM